MWESFQELDCALDVDVKQRNLFIFLDLCDLRLCSTVEIGVYLTMFNEVILLYHLLKLFLVDVEIVLSVNFSWSWCSGGVGHTKTKRIWIL